MKSERNNIVQAQQRTTRSTQMLGGSCAARSRMSTRKKVAAIIHSTAWSFIWSCQLNPELFKADFALLISNGDNDASYR